MLAEGTVIGPYRVVRLLGKGGMAEVYEVENRVEHVERVEGVGVLGGSVAPRKGVEQFTRKSLSILYSRMLPII